MTAYVDLDYMKAMGSIPSSLLDELEANEPDTFSSMSEAVSRLVDSKLLKRYATPFEEPVPESIKLAVAQILSLQIRIRIGFDPGSMQDEQIVKARDDAMTWLEQAANAKDGLVELPLREPDEGQKDATGVARRKSRAFSYRNAMDWHQAQKRR